MEESRECESDVLVLLEDVEDAEAGLEHPLGVIGREIFQCLCRRVRVLRLEEGVEITLRRGLLKFHVTFQEIVDGNEFPDWEGRRDRGVDFDL